ncbi:Electron transport complex subunit RsxB [compost metagenome]
MDAIVGANKHMHTVLDDWCTGCDLCVAPCPVDCIEMVPAGRTWGAQDAAISRERHRSHQARMEHLAADNARLMAPEAPASPSTPAADAGNEERKRSAIESALARARARRNA